MATTFRSGESLGAAKARQQSTSGKINTKRRRSIRGGRSMAGTTRYKHAAPAPDAPAKEQTDYLTRENIAAQRSRLQHRVADKKRAEVRAKAPAKPKSPVVKPPATPRSEPTAHQSTSGPLGTVAPTKRQVFKAPTTTPYSQKIDQATYDEVAASQKELAGMVGSAGLIIKDKYRNDATSYNQAYWASRKAAGATNAELRAEQEKIGMKKAYSGDRVIREEDALAAQYKLKGIGEFAAASGIKPTQETTKSGLFDETTTTKSTYDLGGAGTHTVTQRVTDPVIKGFRLGETKTETFVDGVAAATKTGDAPATSPTRGAIDDTTAINPESLTTVDQVQQAINDTTDKKVLAALHARLRSLMRAARTRTKFGGLNISQAEVEQTKLGGVTRIK